jgi:hypothetical protein
MQFDVLSLQSMIELIELKLLPNNQYMTLNIFTHVFSNFKKEFAPQKFHKYPTNVACAIEHML